MPRYIEEIVSEQIRKSELARRRVQEQGEPAPRPVITISRRMGSGARIVAQKLADDLGWSLWARELIDAIAENADVSRRVVEAFDEHAISDIEAFTRSVLGDHEMGGFIYGRHLAKTIGSIGKLGNAIILGRGANFLLPKALNVRIDASDETRFSNMVTYENMTREEAEAKVRKSDRDRRDFLISTFGREKVEHARYDLTIWMDEFRPDDAVEIIKTALEVWRHRHPDRDSMI